MTDVKQAATELLASIDGLRLAFAMGYGANCLVAVDRYAEAKAALRDALKEGER